MAALQALQWAAPGLSQAVFTYLAAPRLACSCPECVCPPCTAEPPSFRSTAVLVLYGVAVGVLLTLVVLFTQPFLSHVRGLAESAARARAEGRGSGVCAVRRGRLERAVA